MNGLSRVIALSFVIASVLVSVGVMEARAAGAKAKVEAAQAKGLPVFVDVGRTSCVPCQLMVPVLAELTKKYKGRVEVVFVHMDEERDYSRELGVTMIPTQIYFDKDGKELARHIGYMPVEECEKMISKAGPVGQGKVCGPGKVCK